MNDKASLPPAGNRKSDGGKLQKSELSVRFTTDVPPLPPSSGAAAEICRHNHEDSNGGGAGRWRSIKASVIAFIKYSCARNDSGRQR